MGMKKDILWPFLANLFERWRNGVRWPRANQGYIAKWREVVAAAAIVDIKFYNTRVFDIKFYNTRVFDIKFMQLLHKNEIRLSNLII